LIPQRSLEVEISKSTVHKVLHKKLKLHAYKILLLHEIKAADKPKRKKSAERMLETIDNDPNFMCNITFTDEATFHINGCINRHNCWIWGSEKPHVTYEFVRDLPKLNVWCGLMHNRIFGLFIFAEHIINGMMFLDMLELFLFPQVDDLPNAGDIYLQLDRAPPHYSDLVRAALDEKFPNKWISRSGPIPWPPRSPNLTVFDFFFCGGTSRTLCMPKK
jgi:hypothetical protein